MTESPIGSNKEPVIDNIIAAATAGRFHNKVEVNDPVLSRAQEKSLLQDFARRYGTTGYQLNNLLARTLTHLATPVLARPLRIAGQENLAAIPGAAIVTCNHFYYFDHLMIRRALGFPRMIAVSEASNLKLPHILGYLMRYADTLPLGDSHLYQKKFFMPQLAQHLSRGRKVLIFPERQMWYKYRKPRPLSRGAYFYAAYFQVPIISCFITMTPIGQKGNSEFQKLSYHLHFLEPILPDPGQSVRANSLFMQERDYQQKVASYEKSYHLMLDRNFSDRDIAGWRRDTGRNE